MRITGSETEMTSEAVRISEAKRIQEQLERAFDGGAWHGPAVLELLGYRIPALNFLGFYAAGVESALLIWLSVDKHGVADRAIHEHSSGWLIRIGEVLNGPLALILRFFGLVPFAAISFLIGALVSRVGWIVVGKVSGADPEAVFASQR